MSVVVKGIPQALAALARVQAEMEAAAPIAVGSSGKAVARAALARVPRDTGATANSLRVEVDSSDNGAEANVGVTTPYARFTEYGTVYIPAQHWLSDAANSSSNTVVAIMAAVFKAAIH